MNLFNVLGGWWKKQGGDVVESWSGENEITVKTFVDVVPRPAIVRRFAHIFVKNFFHLRQSLDEDWLKEMQVNTFKLLNYSLEINPQNWRHRYHNHQWNCQLHCFDYALWAARAFVEDHNPIPIHHCQSLIEWWIKQTREGRGDGWKPYPTSLRIVNWIYSYVLAADQYDDQVFLGRWRGSIYQQLEFLSRNVEYRVAGNELIKILKALIIGYLFFEKPDKLLKWEPLFWKQFEEQILNDGGHFERSPMYHAYVLSDLMECYILLREFKHFPPSGDAQRTLLLMARFLDDMTCVGGTIAQFNDSACTDTMSSGDILRSASVICGYNPGSSYEVGRKRGQFPDSGYFVWNSDDDQEKIVIDAGPPSVKHLPDHAHCDMLSYELYIFGGAFITDSGVHGYESDQYREYCRSTRAHNTVMFDGFEQSQIKGDFGIKRQADLISAESYDDPGRGLFTFEGEYVRYDRRLIHRRHVTRRYNDEFQCFEWMVEDVAVDGHMDVASSFIHLHPSWSAKELTRKEFNKRWVLCECGPSKHVLVEAFAEERDPDPEEDVAVTILRGEMSPIQGWFFPDFGVARKSFTIRFDFMVHTGDKFGYRIRAIS